MFSVHHEKSFVPVFKVSIDHLFVNLESGKKITFFEKDLGKVLNFGSKNLYEPCSPLSLIILSSRLILSSTSVYS